MFSTVMPLIEMIANFAKDSSSAFIKVLKA